MRIEDRLRRWAGVPEGTGEVLHSPSGAVLLVAGDVVVKVHRKGTDRQELAARLRLACSTPQLLSPLSGEPEPGPDGRWVTRWPRVAPLLPDPLTAPWREAGTLLADLHRAEPPAGPPDGAMRRLRRSLDRMVEARRERIAGAEVRAATDVVRAVAPESVPSQGRPVALVHGDWHLGQLGRTGDDRWLLLDVDDLGRGDPAWDLGRPAGFWAAGLLPDEDWYAFLSAYRARGGPAVPPDGDPWPALEPVARASVAQAAATGLTRAIRAGRRPDELDEALVSACARML